MTKPTTKIPMYKTQMYKRSGFKWSVNECLRVEREYDLLKLSIPEIALLHERSIEAIMYKLDKEGIADYNELYSKIKSNGQYFQQDDDESEQDELDDDEESYQEESEEDQEESEESEESEEDQEEEEDDTNNNYGLKQQVRMLTKQLANLTSIVYKSLVGGKSDPKVSAFH
jgi:hypothetical protein